MSNTNTLLLLLGLYLFSKYQHSVPARAARAARAAADEAKQAGRAARATAKAVKKAAAHAPGAAANVLQRGGAAVYDALHDDDAHKQHLPGHQLTREAVLELATKAGFPDPKLASAIAFAESGGVPGALHVTPRETSIGLWQINVQAHDYKVEDLRDPAKNAAAAFEISKGGTDWSPWTAFKSGAYRKFQTGIFAP